MDNMRIAVSCKSTEWDNIVVEGRRVGDVIASAIQKMEDDHGEGVMVTITVQATSDEVNF